MPKLAARTRARRRQALIAAGWHCLDRTGYRDMTVDDICREAKVSKGAFYGYFPHKQTLLLALLHDESERIEQVMLELQTASMSAGARLQAFAVAMLERAQQPGRIQISTDIWSGMLTDPAMRETLVTATAQRRRRLRAWVEAGVTRGELVAAPANALASLLLALGDGLTLHAGLDPEAFRWDNIRLTLDLLLAALQPG